MDVTISKKWKLVILVALVLAAAPLYFASGPGMERITKQLWARSTESDTPVKLYKAISFYNYTMRDGDADTLAMEWLKHYGGDETLKADKNYRFNSWDDTICPWNDDNPRPAQNGEDYRPTPHPLTARVLMMWADHLENGHRLAEATHIYTLLTNDAYCKEYNLQVDPDVLKEAQKGVQRNSSGAR